MKITIFIHSLGLGGAERTTAFLADYWARRGHDVLVVTQAPKQRDEFVLDGRVRRVSLDSEFESRSFIHALLSNVRRLLTLRTVLRDERADVALGVMSISSVLLAIAGLGLPGIRLGTEHTHPPGAPLARPWALLRKASYGALDAVVALTERTESWILQNTWARRTFVIANPLVLPLPTLGNVIKPDDVLPKHSRTLLCVGRMVPAKRFDRAVEAFSRLAGAHPDWVLAIIGDGPLRQDLTEQIGRLPCRDRVFVPGSVGNTADWYEQSDCLALTSDVEGFPNALLEAMAHGLCCVALDCDTGPRDLIDDGIDGLLVPAGDVDGLVFALDRCMSDSALRRRLGERAAAAAKRYEIDEVAAQWRRLGREFGVDWH